ncbi:hypothetical protein ASD04_04760 [Devosia sp. Root436]|nr:hypothetical protein ASD04_04760 [Devosia sp. Root436]
MLAQLGAAAAAVLHQEAGNLPDALDDSPIDDRPAVAFRFDKSGTCQNSQVAGHGVLRDIEAACDLTCREAFGLMFHEQSKGIEARCLRQGGEYLYGVI